jgi:hypothetical protein
MVCATVLYFHAAAILFHHVPVQRVGSWLSIIEPTSQNRYWVHKISVVHHDFHSQENIPLRVLISATDLGLDGPHLIGFINLVNRGLRTRSTAPWTYSMELSLGK